MPSITAQQLVSDAYTILGYISDGQTLTSADASLARRFMNDMLSEWSQRPRFIPFVARERFDLVVDQGGEDDPYTIGPGGDFDTVRPPNQNSIMGANLILTATDPEVRIGLDIYTDGAYFANHVPGQTSTQPTGIYYNPTYEDDFGSVYVWPVPTTAQNDLELLIQKSVAEFADLSTAYDVPAGFPRLMKYNLAATLAPIVGRDMPPAAMQIAVSSLGAFKRSTLNVSDLPNDASCVSSYRSGLYNIISDQTRG